MLAGAQAVFAKRGLEAATMDDLALAAATTKPTLYARFGSKRQLYARIVEDAAEQFIARILQSYDLPSAMSVRDMVQVTVAIWFSYFDERPDVLRLLFAPDRSEDAEIIAEDVEVRIIEGLSASIERTLARSGRDAPRQARFLASMVFGAVLSATRDNVRTGGLSLEETVELTTAFLSAAYVNVDPALLTVDGPTTAARTGHRKKFREHRPPRFAGRGDV